MTGNDPMIVVGAGLGGLSAAAHLCKQGRNVMVLERESVPGGRAGRINDAGFSFDTGPTVLTMPELLREVFASVNCEMDDFVTLEALDPLYRACFIDAESIYVRSNKEAMTQEIRDKCGPNDAAAFDNFCKWLEQLYATEMPSFINRNYDSPLDLARPLAPMLKLWRLGAFGNLSKAVSRYFGDDRLLRLFSFQSMYAGLPPHQALAVYAVITYMDTVEGVYFPLGGIHAIATGLAKALEESGVQFRYDATVDEFVRDSNGRIIGVSLDNGEFIKSSAVVCNPDLPVAYRELLPDIAPPRRLRHAKYSPSAVVWHAGVRGSVDSDVAHHNIHFGKQWNESFEALFKQGLRMPDPSTLVSVPTLSDPSMAPDGHTTLYVLEPVPNLDGNINWKTERRHIHDELAQRIDTLGYPSQVVTEHLTDPLDWQRLGMEQGTPFALSHSFFQSGPFRPANHDQRVPGLFFAGSSTVPGVGVPMVLISGRLAAERVERYVDGNE